MEDHYIGYLITRLRENGVSKANSYQATRNLIRSWMKKGKLILRRMPASRRYVITPQEVNEIIKAFSPGGLGEWHYQL